MPGDAAQILFNVDVSPRTVEHARITWRPESPTREAPEVTGTAHYDAYTRRVTLKPTAPLVVGVRYVATLDGPLLSSLGYPLAAPVTWEVEPASRLPRR